MDLWILLLREELERRLDEPRLLERLADARQISPERLSQRFADATGVVPDEFLQHLRLARAKVLLERTFLSVRQVMHVVGLHDRRAFEQAFQRQHGVTPAAVRERAWNGRNGQGASPAPAMNIPARRRASRG